MAKRDLYSEVTESIIEALERGVTPWVRPWASVDCSCRNAITGRPYRGVNPCLLYVACERNGWTDPRFCTFKQAKAIGAHVRKGERSTLIVFWKRIVKTERDATGTEKKTPIFFLRHFNVFNVAQLDGVDESKLALLSVPTSEPIRDAECDRFVASTGASIAHAGDRACYSPATDAIRMPERAAFTDAGAYYATLFHELTHWTGHESRCARDLSGRFGSESYAAEELVAELGAAFLCERLRVDGNLQHPEYVASWLKVLRNDKRAIFTAASHARKATEFMFEKAGIEASDDVVSPVAA